MYKINDLVTYVGDDFFIFLTKYNDYVVKDIRLTDLIESEYYIELKGVSGFWRSSLFNLQSANNNKG